MKKLIALVLVTLISGTLAAQLQPVTNVQWNQWYSGHNYFTFSRDAPIPTKEQLTGYNVYRANEFYRFQTSRTLFHHSDTSNCDEDFVMYNGGAPFFMHVTAVYNNGMDESGYVDSAYCFGFAIGMNKTKSAESTLCPNPTPAY